MMARIRTKLSYGNVVATMALFLALSGGAVYAAAKIHTWNIAGHAVTTRKIAKGAVKTHQLAAGAVTSAKIRDGTIRPQDMGSGFTNVTATLNGGMLPVTAGPDPYPLTPDQWVQKAGESDLLFGRVNGTIASLSPPSSCDVFVNFQIPDIQAIGGLFLTSSSGTPEQVSFGSAVAAAVDAEASTTHVVHATVSSNGNCTPGSSVDSFKLRVIALF